MDIEDIKNKIRKFAKDRDWDQFHNPKNLSMALAKESAELLEIFQWLNEEESQNLSSKDLDLVKEELADIFIYLIRIADKFDIDIENAILKKMELNSKKYPIALSKGNATKYNKR